MKRPYFHIKPLDRRQLKNWNEYVDFEMKEGNPYRIIMCFERCLVSCAQYEEVWCRYAQYMEEHVALVKAGHYAGETQSDDHADKTICNDSVLVDKDSNADPNNSSGKAACVPALGGDVNSPGVGEVSTKLSSDGVTCTGFTSTSEQTKAGTNSQSSATQLGTSDTFVHVSANIVDREQLISESNINSSVDGVKDNSSVKEQSNKASRVTNSNTSDPKMDVDDVVVIKSEPVDEDVICINDSSSNCQHQLAENNSVALLKSGRGCWTYQDVRSYVSTGVGLVGRVLACPPLTQEWTTSGVEWEDVRQVYRRAAWIHCPNKPLITMQWALFEESQGELHRHMRLLCGNNTMKQ